MNNITGRILRNRLGNCYSAREAAALARIICCEILGQSQTDFYLGKDITLSLNRETELEEILRRLCNFEPIQYIQGESLFLGRHFKVMPGVLIPRPETEELVEMMLHELPAFTGRILDIGTGSGCIALTLALELPEASLFAWDVSAEALAVAQLNSEILQATVHMFQRDVLTYHPTADDRYDVIVSNPPYVLETERQEMESNVLNWEPALALFVPDEDPLRFYRRIGELGWKMLKNRGKLYFEINRACGSLMKDLLLSLGYHDVEIRKDMAGENRFAVAIK